MITRGHRLAVTTAPTKTGERLASRFPSPHPGAAQPIRIPGGASTAYLCQHRTAACQATFPEYRCRAASPLVPTKAPIADQDSRAARACRTASTR